jgi:hypothetical protein
MTQSLLTLLTPASNRELTTLAVVKDEIDTTGGDSDARLLRWIAEESERIETYLGRVLAQEVVIGPLVLSRRRITTGLLLRRRAGLDSDRR